jgi:hypothetical protein
LELEQVDRAGVVGVEHLDHELASLLAELGPVAVDESALQFVRVDLGPIL